MRYARTARQSAKVATVARMATVVRAMVIAAVTTAVYGVAHPATAAAQVFSVGRDSTARGTGVQHSPVLAGIAFTYAVPQRDFRQNVRQGFGADGNVHYKLDRRGILSLGGELGFLGYGRETKRVPLSSTVGGRILVDLTTSNNVFWLGVGPQLTAPSGPIRPYVNGTAGFAVFWTESSVKGDYDSESFASTNNYNDATFAWTAGGGFLIPVGTSKQGAIDFGVRWNGNGNTRYLRRGDIIDLPNGSVQLRVNEGETPMLMWRLGLRWGLF
ncbi:MAG TPA: hypothetical protein VFV33_07795 [Gemmatimonadaceae bacterium]|nr:hypothetical protein [Gemmatimonadaceae bacterium]